MLPPTLTNTRRIKRFSPLQLGKVLAVLYGLIGLVFLPFMFIAALFGSNLPPQQRIGFLAMGVGFTLFFPVIYAVFGFVFGVIGAFVYNVVAKWIGGIEVQVE